MKATDSNESCESNDVKGTAEKEIQNDHSRRETLKKAGIAGGALAGTVWAKPVINAVVLPSHATTSDIGGDTGTPPPVTLVGPTGSPMMGSLEKSNDTSIAERVMETLIPSATAAGTPPPFGGARFALNPQALGLCVTLDFPQGNTPSGPINVSVAGPTVEYYYNGFQTYNLSSSGSGALSGLDFMVNLSGAGGSTLQVSGRLSDNDFSGATGYVELLRDVPQFFNNPLGVEEFSGYGAPFDASSGAACSPGDGMLPQ